MLTKKCNLSSQHFLSLSPGELFFAARNFKPAAWNFLRPIDMYQLKILSHPRPADRKPHYMAFLNFDVNFRCDILSRFCTIIDDLIHEFNEIWEIHGYLPTRSLSHWPTPHMHRNLLYYQMEIPRHGEYRFPEKKHLSTFQGLLQGHFCSFQGHFQCYSTCNHSKEIQGNSTKSWISM